MTDLDRQYNELKVPNLEKLGANVDMINKIEDFTKYASNKGVFLSRDQDELSGKELRELIYNFFGISETLLVIEEQKVLNIFKTNLKDANANV